MVSMKQNRGFPSRPRVKKGTSHHLTLIKERTKKVVSDSPGLVDFAIGLVIFVLKLSRRASAVFWGNLNLLHKDFNQSC